MRISDWSSDVCSSDLEWGPLVGYLSDAVTGTVEELFATRDGLNALKEQWRGRRKFRSNSAALRALDLLSDYPVVTMKRLAQKLGVSRPQDLRSDARRGGKGGVGLCRSRWSPDENKKIKKIIIKVK